MFITLLVVGCLGAVAGQGDAFEPYLKEHKAFGKAVAAMICLYGEFLSFLMIHCVLPSDRQYSPLTSRGVPSHG